MNNWYNALGGAVKSLGAVSALEELANIIVGVGPGSRWAAQVLQVLAHGEDLKLADALLAIADQLKKDRHNEQIRIVDRVAQHHAFQALADHSERSMEILRILWVKRLYFCDSSLQAKSWVQVCFEDNGQGDPIYQ